MATASTQIEPTEEGGAKPFADRLPRWLLVALLSLCLLPICLLWSGRAPADATQPLLWHASPVTSAASTGPLRVATFNIHSGKGSDERRDLDRTAAQIYGMHLVALNEVRGGFAAESNQSAVLAEQLGMGWLFAPTERRWGRDHFGNALLATVAPETMLTVPLPHGDSKSYRNSVLATVPYRGRKVRVLAVHVDRRDDRRLQLRAVIDLFLALEAPAILLGDLNSSGDDPLLAELLATPGVDDAVGTFLAGEDPAGRIDWIITRGMRTVSAACLQTDASDHPVVWADLELE